MDSSLPYVDGFLIAVPKANMESYKAMATIGAKVWMKHGALDYKECVGEDLSPSMGEEKVGRFGELLKNSPDETVIFSFIVFKSRAHRDEVNAKVMQDPEMQPEAYEGLGMPFTMDRMFYAGFETFVDGPTQL